MSQNDTDGTQYDEFLTEELNRMRAAGGGVNKIQMIKRLREKSGLGLKEAKDAVEAFEARHNQGLKAEAAGTGGPMRQSDTDGVRYDEFLTEELNRMRAAGGGVNKIQMIKRLREKSGLGLKEAKDAVEAFGARHCPELKAVAAGPGCLIVLIATLLLVALVLGVPWLMER